MNNFGIETLYKGIQFRSRLEAKWACFFDNLGWRWEYEPTDFNGWIPDFAIYGKEIVYVEVKPVIDFPKWVSEKIDSSGCDTETLIVGQSVRQPLSDYDGRKLGWLREMSMDGKWWWEEAAFGKWKIGEGKIIGFCHCHGRYVDRITGGYDGGSHGDLWLDDVEIDLLWAKASNVTQWHGTKRHLI